MKQHRRLVLVISVALTCFVIGSAVTGYVLNRQQSEKLHNPKFLQNALQKVDPSKIEKPRQRPPALVRVSAAERKPINTVRQFYGNLTEIQLASISTEVAGIIVDLPIEIGQRVEGGKTLLAQIDTTWLKLNIAQTEAEIKILDKQYAHQLSELERIEKLLTGRATTESEISNQRMLTEQFRQGLEKAEIAHRETTEKLQRASILAPFDGYVVRRLADKGELLSPGTTIADIVSLGQIDAIVNIGEEFINHIKIGAAMPIFIDKLNLNVTGNVHAIVPYDVLKTRTFPVIVRLDDRNGELKAGMSATALVSITDPKEEVVVLKDAVLQKPDGATVWLAVSEAGGATLGSETSDTILAQPVPVIITAENVNQYGVEPETDEGKHLLVAGARTIIEGAERLTPNQHIRITGIDPKFLDNLPPSSGHRVVKPKERLTELQP